MSVRATDVEMSSDVSPHWARQVSEHGWTVSWLPGRVVDRNAATTAMVIAETVATMVAEEATYEHRMWPRLERWAAELGLSGPDAMVLASGPPDGDQDDPGPAPEAVEPESAAMVTTIAASPRAQVRVKVTADVGRTGLTGLTVETAAGDSVTVALPSESVDALLEALAAAAPIPYLPRLPQVKVYVPGAVDGNGGSGS